jgi:hypothetical protein
MRELIHRDGPFLARLTAKPNELILQAGRCVDIIGVAIGKAPIAQHDRICGAFRLSVSPWQSK